VIWILFQWPKNGVDFAGKSVAVIGTGSSGVQTIPVVAETCKDLTVFQRTPTYTIPGGLEECERPGGGNDSLTRFRLFVIFRCLFQPGTGRLRPKNWKPLSSTPRSSARSVFPTLSATLHLRVRRSLGEISRKRRGKRGWSTSGTWAA
jgi:cation diffusion facilitator CzcD-associated flavoprotein CzcO